MLPKVAALACGMGGPVEFCKLYPAVRRYPATDLTGAPHPFGIKIESFEKVNLFNVKYKAARNSEGSVKILDA